MVEMVVEMVIEVVVVVVVGAMFLFIWLLLHSYGWSYMFYD